MSWGCAGCTGSRAAARRPPAPMSNYPFADVLRLVALESRRHGCAVIGEDLGTVPDGFRETMRAANVLSYRMLVFERHGDGSFMPPDEYPPLAAASAATHDLATVKGFWLGGDIAWRRRLGLYPDEAAEATEADERSRDRHLLLEALAGEGLLAPERFGVICPRRRAGLFRRAGQAILVYLGALAGAADAGAARGRVAKPSRPTCRARPMPTRTGAAACSAARRAARRAGDGADRCAGRGGAPAVGRRKAAGDERAGGERCDPRHLPPAVP